MSQQNNARGARSRLLCYTALASLVFSTSALAQAGSISEQKSPTSSSQGAGASAAAQAGAPPAAVNPTRSTTEAPATASAGSTGTALQEVVVTAQKRSQNLQNVPISVTAITADSLQAQRINDVLDLASVAPNLTVRPAAGSVGLPLFSMRGINSYGVVPGSDKEISIYIDGVYLGNTFASSFDLPDISRIEVLHGPQGTLFGRNATAGAISIVTPDPPGKFGLHQEVTFGNYSERRVKTRLDTDTYGPFSATFAYVHDQRDGDVKNTGAGTVWLRPEAGIDEPSRQVSPKYLGSSDKNEYFGALRFHPNSQLNVVYKFDYSENYFTPQATAPVGVNPGFLGPQTGGFLQAVLATQTNPVVFDTSAKRPDSVNNSFSTPGYERSFGHNLTVTYKLTDQITFKNIASYRTSFLYSNDQLDGLGGLTITPITAAVIPSLAPLVGSPLELLVINTEEAANQWSDEPQINYDSKYLTLTLGALFFHQNSRSGAPPGLSNNLQFAFLPGNVVTPGASTSYNINKSTAGYIQAEGHVLPNLDIVGGFRTTTDNKSGTLINPGVPLSFVYAKTKPSYLIGVNYKPFRDTLLYAKYSTAFVSGGAEGPITFQPETAKSYEAGIKSDFFNHRLRADLSVFDVKYLNLQAAESGVNVGQPNLGTVIVDLGNEKARGFEFQGNAVPIKNLTLGVGIGYTDFHYRNLNPILGTRSTYLPSLEPKFTTTLSAQYETEPLFGDARLLFRSDADYHGRERLDAFAIPMFNNAFPGLVEAPAEWEVSARIVLEHIDLPIGRAQVALWAKNLTDDRSAAFPGDFEFEGNATFVPARTYGIDLIFDY